MPSQSEIESSIVRVLNAQGTVVGTGFVVDNGLILTCAHVIAAAKGKPGDAIQIALHFDDKPFDAHIVPEWWRDPDAEDVAVLQPIEPLPKSVQALPLGLAKASRGHEFYSRGYRLADQFPQGLDAEGRIQSLTTHHGQLVLQLLTNQIDQGMSGAPIFNTQTQRVIGMANFFWETSRHADGWLAGAVPAETLNAICDALILHPPQAIDDYLAAVREYCANLPYLTLHDIRPPRTLDEVYVPLKARQQSRKDENQPKEEPKDVEGETLQFQPLSIAEVMQSHDAPHVLILGEPGAGKSTLLRQMAERAWDAPQAIGLSEPYLPLLVPLRQLVMGDGSLEKRLSHALVSEMSLAHDLPEDYLVQWPQLTDAHWLILLDALDEVPDSERAHLIQWLKGQLQNLREHRVVVTSRSTGYKDDFASLAFGQYDLLPFTPEQTSEFARKWFHDTAESFQKELDRIRAGDLRGTPLLLTIAAKVFGERGALPERRSNLYSQFVAIWLDEARLRDQKRELSDRLWNVAPFVLARIALTLTEQPDLTTEQPLNDVAANYLNKELDFKRDEAEVSGRKLVQLLGRRSGVFTRRGNLYQFAHPTFREYFAARAIVRECDQELDCVWHRAVILWRNSDWREVALFALSILSDDKNSPADVTPLLQRIKPHHTTEALYFVSAAIAEQINVDMSFTNRVIDLLIQQANDLAANDVRLILTEMSRYPHAEEALLSVVHNGQHADVRVMAVEILHRLGRREVALSLLYTSVQNEQDHTLNRLVAAEALGDLGQRDIATSALLSLARDQQAKADVRVGSAIVLNRIGHADETAQAWLALALDRQMDQEVRLQAVDMLGQFGRVGETAQAWLALALDERVDERTRRHAAETLGQLERTDEAVQAWSALALDKNVNMWMRQTAAEALERMKYYDKAVQACLMLAFDKQIVLQIRLQAARLLSQLQRTEEAAQVWLTFAQDERMGVRERKEAAESLDKLGRKDEAISILLAIARDKSASVWGRKEAAESLDKLGRKDEAISILLAIARDKSASVWERREVAESLGKLGGLNEAIPILLAIARDKSASVWERRKAAESLGKLGQMDGAIPILLMLASNRSASVQERREAAESLGRLGQLDEALPILLALMHDENASVWERKETAESLDKLGRLDGTIPILLMLAHDEDASVWKRREAAESLGKLGRLDEAIPILLMLAHDDHLNAGERREAAESLGKLGRLDEAIPILLMLAHDDHLNAGERREAAESLGKLGRLDEAIPILLMLAHDDHLNAGERREAAESLGKLGQMDGAIPILLTLASDRSASVWERREIAESLGRLGRLDEALPILLELAHGNNANVWERQHAAGALNRLGRVEEATQVWLALAHNKRLDSTLRIRAVEMLGEYGDAGILPDLEQLSRVNALARLFTSRSGGKILRRAALEAADHIRARLGNQSS
jgi:tetratricopeptide (TPR) repeat protein